ncbi:glycosyltransferase family 2 protein [Phyllobacterium zundukense]|uniref:Glycosyltransferase family 2 protein n=1 Tax=Phyllobacterium zundukense TaxID=1867719 RepID=A0ACD4CZD0_9HYPH|nr:glycosyltransferase family A protein [Phyllobacterium zundukense]UXN58955.1 glycosyltransferase family 2 protein [Phyllobacterium zundukense]
MAETTRPLSKRKASIVTIIPYYNGSAFVERAVKSAFGQSVLADELIVVNDGSTESEAAFVRDLGERMKFKVIDQANGGQGSARNAGVAASTSEYICFLDQDDFYLPTHNEILANGIPHDNKRFGWVYADLYRAEVNGTLVKKEIVKNYGEHPKSSLHQVLGTNLMILPSASLISRRAFEDVGGFDEQFTGYEDDDLFIRLFRAGYSNDFISKHVAVWCMHDESTSNSIRMSRSRLKFFKKWASIFPDDPSTGEFILRDCLVPRFHTDFIGESMTAMLQDQESKTNIYIHRPELRHILNEYAGIVLRSPSVSQKMKFRLRVQLAILSLDSKIAGSAARGAMRFLRSLKGS